MLTEQKVIEYSNKCIDVLGRKIYANRIIRFTNKDGKPDIDKKAILFERTFEDYDLEISFLGENDVHLAIFFGGELVFNTVGDAYKKEEYDCSSPVFQKLYDSDGHCAENCFEHGDWEELLEYVADNAERIKKALDAFSAETKKLMKKIARRNELMVNHLPFRHFGNRHFYQDDVVHVELINGSTKVYTLKVSGLFKTKVDFKDCVFDAIENTYKTGPWEKHIETIINKQIEKVNNSNYDPVSLKSKAEMQAQKKKKVEKKSAKEHISEINEII